MRDARALIAVALACVAACAPPAQLPSAAPSAERDIVLNGHSLRLHLANPHARGKPLLVYATGDGGWHRKDLDAWKHLRSWGYPAVGFDARDYVTHLGPSSESTTTPERLAEDYFRIVDAGREALGLESGHATVLVGVSRGADLAVAAAGAPPMHGEVDGVLAVALTREEEYVRIDALYSYLSDKVRDIPVAVVQSTRDNYLPAAEARALFGPDTAVRRFQEVDARNHSFAGARSDLYRAMSDALDWIDGLAAGR